MNKIKKIDIEEHKRIINEHISELDDRGLLVETATKLNLLIENHNEWIEQKRFEKTEEATEIHSTISFPDYCECEENQTGSFHNICTKCGKFIRDRWLGTNKE